MSGVTAIMEGGPVDGRLISLPQAVPYVKIPYVNEIPYVGEVSPDDTPKLLSGGYHKYTRTDKLSGAGWSLGALIYRFSETILSH